MSNNNNPNGNIANPNNAPPTAPGEPNLQPGIQATTILVTVLADIFVILRLLTRKFVVKSLGWDDWTIVAAALGITIGCALVLVEVHYGFGRHKADLSKEAYIEFTRFSYGEWIQTFQTLMFTKISICLFLLRIVINRAFVYSLWALIAILVISNFILTVMWIVQCNPTWLAWLSPMEPGRCFQQDELQQIILAQAIVAIFSDFALATYPIFIVRKIKMAMRIKVGLCVLMGLGVITGTFCIVRTIGNWQNINNDPPWNSVSNWYWRSWEVCVGIIVACVPTLRPGYKSLRGRWQSYISSRSDRTSRRSSGRTLQPSDPSERRAIAGRPRHSAETTPEMEKPLPAVPALPLPVNALRPDLRAMRGMDNTECAYDAGHQVPMPIEDALNVGIVKTTRVDLEDQRIPIHGREDVEARFGPSVQGWNSPAPGR